MKNFILPNMYEHYNLNFKLLQMMEQSPYLFNDNTKVHCCYGNFQFCLWDGGRIFNQIIQTDKEQMIDILNEYKNYNVKIRYIFTNNQLQAEHYLNRFCNLILEVSQKYDIELVVNDEKLMHYIKETYPNYTQYISSTTKCITDFQQLETELSKEEYKMVCLDYNMNKNKKIFNLNQEIKNKIEFLCNAVCASACPNRKEHYRLNSLSNIQYGKKYAMENCFIFHNTLMPDEERYHNNISPEEINTIYEPNGFKFFKLEGRTLSSVENACNYVKYLVKPEYQLFVLSQLLE